MSYLTICLRIIPLLVIPFLGVEAQNLVPNPSFETYSSCPMGFGSGGSMNCQPWFNANDANCDYFNACSSSWLCDVPLNYSGFQMPRTGDAYCGFWAKAFKPSNHYFEYLEAPLTTTLEAGKAYKVQFYVSLPGKFCAVSHLGAYFSVGALTVPGWETLPFTPQVESNTGFLSDTVNWMLIKGCFIAAGGESHIVIGNFRTFDDTPLDPFCSAPIDTQSYYFIEDVSVVPVQPTGFSFDLGGPVTECYQYTIAPGLSGVNYYWENGSTDSTLTVTTSGVYSLTVYDGCLGGVDSVEVNITNKPAIEFNPNSYSICEGSSLIVSLDPDEGTYLWQDGSASTYYIISTSGTYSVTLNDGCDLTFDTIGITVVEPPVPFSLGNDTILCTGTEIEFIFDPSLGAFMWQDSNTSPAVIITQGGLYALTISNVCGEVSDQVQVIELAIPVVSLGPPSDVLCNGDFIDISLDPDLGTYQWQDGSTALNYQINTTGMYSVTLTNTCGQANDSLEIITLAAPDFDLGDSLDACPGDTIILNANFAMSQYAWQDGSVNDSLMVTSSGMYALTVENVCGSHSDSVAIMYVQALSQPDLGPDVNLCPGEKVVFHTDAPGAEFLWNDLSTADSLVAIMAGIYFVHVTNYCSTYADTVVVTTTSAPPNLNLPADFALCQGQIVMLNSNVTGVNYLWSDGSSDAQLAVASPGMYACTISNACGVDVDSVLISDGGSAPTVSLGMDTSICEGTTLTLVPGSSGAAAWLWQDGSVDSVYQVSLAGEYHVECANNCGVAYDTMMISVLPAIPDLSFGPDTAICPNTFILLSINIPNVNIQWSDGSSDSIFVISDGGIVFASISNSCGMSADSLMISMLPAIPVLDLGEDQKICQGEMVTIDPNIPNVNYTWQDGSSDSQLLVTQGELVVLTIDNACGISTDSVLFTESLIGPDVNLGPDVVACEGEIVTLYAGIEGVNYLWQDGSGIDSFTTSVSGEFHLTVDNVCGTDSDTVLVDISGVSPLPDLGSDTTLCEGTSLLLTSDADAYTNASWQDGSGTKTYLVDKPGIFRIIESNHCGVGEDSIEIKYKAAPLSFDIGSDTILCPGQYLLLIAPQTSLERRWQDGSDQPTLAADHEGKYALQVSNECGVEKDSFFLSFDNHTIYFNVDTSYMWCPANNVTLDVTQIFPAFYLWNTGENSSSILIYLPGIYSVEVHTLCVSDSVHTIVKEMQDCNPPIDIFIPNLFTPNGDNINDEFKINLNPGVEIISLEGRMYDRWGNIVFSSTQVPFTWNGRFNEDQLPTGVYVYSIKMVLNNLGNKVEKTLVGDVTLVR